MFHDFEISVTPLRDNEYLVRTERFAPGVPIAEEQVSWPVEDWLKQARQLMNDPLLQLFQGQSGQNGNSTTESSLNLATLGQQLYNGLFHGSLQNALLNAQAIAHNQRAILRIRLWLKDSRLCRIPWEVLQSSDQIPYLESFSPLANGIDVIFSRYLGNRSLRTFSFLSTPETNQRLKVLMVIAGPDDQENLQLKQEAEHLQQELSNSIEFTLLEQPGREQLTQALEQGHYSVFHYAGHSDLGTSGGEVYLVSRKTGLTETLYGDDLAGLLVNNGVELAVFNSCRGSDTALAEMGNVNPDGSIAQALVKQGIPAVLAMAERIPDEVALTFTRLLYRNVNLGYPIDLSLSRARQGLISAYGSNQLYWALPVLYMHPEFNGVLIPGDEAKQNPVALLDLATEEQFLLPQEEQKVSGFSAYSQLPEHPYWMDDEFSEDEEDDDAKALVEGIFSTLEQERVSQVEEDAGFEVSPQMTVVSENPPVDETAAVQLMPAATPSNRLHQWQKTLFEQRKLWVGLITGAVAIAVLGGWLWANRRPTPQELISKIELPTPVPSALNPIALDQVEPSTLTAIAIEQFSQDDISQATAAVQALLDIGALPFAQAALYSASAEKIDTPPILFLRGRLAWQSVIAGNPDYDLLDARRYWELAAKQAPKEITYLNALGFAYYAEGEVERAIDTWYNALELADQPSKQGSTINNHQILTTYAGLALGLRQLGETLSGEQKITMINKSLKLRQKVMTEAPLDFQPDALIDNWMWTEEAIEDWRSLVVLSRE